jgi:hypothetical protein
MPYYQQLRLHVIQEKRPTPLRGHKSANNLLPVENGAQYDQAQAGAKAESPLVLKCPFRSVVWG